MQLIVIFFGCPAATGRKKLKILSPRQDLPAGPSELGTTVRKDFFSNIIAPLPLPGI